MTVIVGRDREFAAVPPFLDGIAGGAVAVAVPAVIQARADDQAAQAAENAKWLKYGQEWENRYRQMYPIIEPRKPSARGARPFRTAAGPTR